jgi:hypothetical protein
MDILFNHLSKRYKINIQNFATIRAEMQHLYTVRDSLAFGDIFYSSLAENYSIP